MTLNNPNKKGILGEAADCKALCLLGYDVFTGFGNHSKVDLTILDEDYRTYKLQIKSTQSKNNVVEVYSVKNCLNSKYNSVYFNKQIDIFAVYVNDRDLVFYVTSKETLHNGRSSKFRISKSRNGQLKNIRYVEDYLDFRKALRDCTPHAQTASVVGDETVQTTTQNFFVAGESQCGK